ncbi:hypothetical protein CASFOL_018464 [Castilleja foliolosa]|uniref:SWI/SNF complex subunit SWI3A n=1 Tax=Castilleja foliolosa TaxID=1961234 RepID=A0ABD3D6T8_9LAMI
MEDLELYTIPSCSSWFAWDNIHEVERFSLREFFDGSSVTRSPRIYKEYRDFIISKYRQEPSRKLTFTEVRKSLVGDVSVLLKVFTFLEKWGLINFNATDDDGKIGIGDGGVRTTSTGCNEEEDDWGGRVKVEEGAPHGVRVVGAPNSMKPIIAPPPPLSVAVDGGGVVGEVGESGFKWPPLASYSDIYGELMRPEKKGLMCGSCKDECDSTHYEYTQERSFILCEKCFKSGNYEKDKFADNFNLKDSVIQAAIWTEAEISLLLESVLKHGEDWDLVAKNVQTKNKLECISKLIQLPFGDLMLGSGYRKGRYVDVIADISDSKQSKLASNSTQEHVKAEEPIPELQDNDPQNGDDEENEGPPLKRVCTGSTPDIGCSLMKEVTRISTMLDPRVTASAAEAAITSLCYENQCSIEIFDDDDGNYVDSESSPETSNQKRCIQETSSVKNIIPLNFRTRAATATALGAAAANAKLLADQEEREIAHLVANMIDAQLKKLRRKMKCFDHLELIMEREYTQLEALEESLVAQRMDILQMVFTAGITK